MRQYLQLTRAHTAPLEVVPAMLGASIAAGEFWSETVALWGIFGLLYHLAGYGMNSYADWRKGFDKDDEYKQHHPLNTGVLSKREAGWTIISLFILTFVYGVVLVIDSPIALTILVVGILSGVVYNELGKVTILKPIPIAIAHTSVYSAAYIDNTGQIHEEFFWLGSLYVFSWVAYQIGLSGELKDIESDPANLLKKSGARIGEGYIHLPFRIEFAGVMIKSVSFLMAMLLSFRDRNVTVYTIPVAFVGSLLISLNQRMLLPGEYDREQRLTIMAVMELLMLATFVISAGWIIGLDAVLTLIIASVLWVVTFNQIQWGTYIAPDV